MTLDTIWLIIGFLGQGIFFMRWVVQWIASERHAESRVPTAFWYMSMIGGLITLAYAIYRQDPVFIAGQSIGSIVYLRNLMLIHRPNQADSRWLQGQQQVSGDVCSEARIQGVQPEPPSRRLPDPLQGFRLSESSLPPYRQRNGCGGFR